MNQQQAHRPNDPTGPSCGDGDANEKLEAARKEGTSVYALAKTQLAKVKSGDSTAYLAKNRQRSAQ